MMNRLNFLILTAVLLGSLVGCAHVQPGETQSIQLQPDELVKNVSPGDFIIAYTRSGSNYSLTVKNIDAVKITGVDKELYIKDITSVTMQVETVRERALTESEKETNALVVIYFVVAIFALLSSLTGGGAGSFP